MKRVIKIAMLCLLCGATGCASYYKVTDPVTGRVYYSRNVMQTDSGATILTDARTGDEITIQNSDVKKISKEEFNQGKSAQPAPAHAPAAGPR